MKKIVMIAFVAAATLSFAACNTKTEGAQGTDADSIKVETPAIEEVVADTTALGQFEALVNQALPLAEKVQKGDAAATEEYAKVSAEVAALGQELQKGLASMTPEQAAKFAELGKKFSEAAPVAAAK
ncbi:MULTISPECIES: hypothetical protein [unclassified Dysgonomonas]|uniref:hypothetical protein n=1 Tax=unclassified Dysgonomonas TaxID=2630389 RepID=UPI00067F9519|nr:MULTISPECIES: hypothetical protein [unclassified Dysgonomonas]MBD8346494.1 hypothetical protein [Dysgonomonas sp. HGC4]MBF0574590.1 hypothetical protein [Dysgonomonas sp. GY617]